MPRPSVRLTVIAALLLASAAGAGADTYPRQPGVDAQHYVFRLSLLTTDSREIRGEATETFAIVADVVREIALDLATPAADGTGMTVTGVTSGGRPVSFSHRDNRLRLPVPPGTRAGQQVSYTISYHGVPAKGLLFVDNIHGERTAFSENWYHHARQWLPMIDHPADKATGEFIITAPADFQVVANGALYEEVDLPDGRRRTHWKESVPISSWLYAVGVAHFAVRHAGTVRGVPLEYWVFPQDVDKGFALFEQDARACFEFFSDRVGPFVYEKLAHVQAAGTTGGMEHATNIFYGEKAIAAGTGPVVHETAHQWFGNAVTESDWNDVWLSEGFATYFTALYTEHASGRDAFVEAMRRGRSSVLELERNLPGTPVVHVNFNETEKQPNNRLVYQKGAWALHMLRAEVGTETFWRAIRAYYRQHLNATASTDDLRLAMERESGQNLEWFFRQWLHQSGVPAVEGTWRYDRTARRVVVTVRQTQSADPYRLPLEVGIVQNPGEPPRVERMRADQREATASFPSDVEPVSVALDPGVWVLADFGVFRKAGS